MLIVRAWKPKGLSEDSIKPPAESKDSLAPALNHINTKLPNKFDGSCSKQEKLTLLIKRSLIFLMPVR